nr:TetR/AcrR family transcriptional regulator [Quadrisphaera sp. RL12-1S]
MDGRVPRSYRSPKREADASATRARVLDAAAELFATRGYAATTMKAVAERAGVSVPTVHLQGAKHALLVAALDRAFAGDEAEQLLTDRPELTAVMAEADVGTAFERYLSFLAEANERSAPLVAALSAAARVDPEAGAAYERLEERRWQDMAVGARWFAARGLLDDDDVPTATDLLGHVLSPQTYLHFTVERGWDTSRYVRWVGHQLRTLREQVAAVEG